MRHCGPHKSGPFRDWLREQMLAQQLTAADVAKLIGRDDAIIRGWFGTSSTSGSL
jgi:hypothetical protein